MLSYEHRNYSKLYTGRRKLKHTFNGQTCLLDVESATGRLFQGLGYVAKKAL